MPLRRLDTVAQLSTMADEFAIGEDDILAQPTGMPVAEWSNTGVVVNKLDVSYDFNESTRPNEFTTRQIYTATASVDRYSAQPPLTSEFRGIHTSLSGQTILARHALLYMQRWGYPPPVLLCSVTFRRHMFEVLDAVRVTHSQIRNPITGKMGLDHELFEVMRVTPSWLIEGRLDLELLWVGAIETSAAPTSGGPLVLVPGTSTIDASDVNIPFGTSITVTTPGSPCSAIRIGLKSLNYRIWGCTWQDDGLNPPPKDGVPSCDIDCGTFTDGLAFTSKITYHIEYKKSTAPDAPGTGTDPNTGWVTLLASTDRGSVSAFGTSPCGGTPGVPSEDIWTHYFPTLGGAPSVYNVKIFFDGLTTQGDPCPNSHTSCCGAVYGTCGSSFISSALITDQIRMTHDFVEGIV